MSVPNLRIRAVNQRLINGEGRYVLYWMIAARRLSWNFALDRALAWCRELGLPLVVFEAVRADYEWSSQRTTAFVLQGMAQNQRAAARCDTTYLPYVEPEPGAGRGLLEALAHDAALVVTDDTPMFFLPRMVEAAGNKLPCLLEAVDGVGLLPIASAGIAFKTAVSFRRLLQRELPNALRHFPRADPLAGLALPRATIAAAIHERWPSLPLPDPAPAPDRVQRFLDGGLAVYHERGNDLNDEATSGLSPGLHFGHVSPHRVFAMIARHEDWSIDHLAHTINGKRDGWWGMRPGAEAFLDQLVTWRELGYNAALRLKHYDRYESLPDWARATLQQHTSDQRPAIYDFDTLAAGETADELWNAAQRQLLREGTIYSYMRMVWGKKVIEWTRTPEAAWDVLAELNNRWALDGRDPNSWSGIAWTFGRYDRGWFERPIFGKVRYMTTASTARKLKVRDYLDRFGRP